MNTQATYKLILALFVVLCYQTTIFSQTTLNCNGSLRINSLTYQDLIIPENISQITIEVRGGDGGNARLDGLTCNIRVRGGKAATVRGTFAVSSDESLDAMRPGGRLRVFTAEAGENEDTGCGPSPTGVYGAGGGSSAVLYLPPNSATSDRWRVLAVAGGGGGGSRPMAGVFRPGNGGTATPEGSGTSDLAGGNAINCPQTDFAVYTGGSINCTGDNIGGNGKTMATVWSGSFSKKTVQVALFDNSQAISTGGTFNNIADGGNGFTGGGASRQGGGGGGGFFGGAAKRTYSGGGGGSYITALYSPTNTNIQAGSKAGSTNHPTRGHAIITTRVSSSAICKANVTVELGQNLSVQEVDMGSVLNCNESFELYDPNLNKSGSSLSYTCADLDNNNLTATLRIKNTNNQVVDECSVKVDVVDTTPPGIENLSGVLLNPSNLPTFRYFLDNDTDPTVVVYPHLLFNWPDQCNVEITEARVNNIPASQDATGSFYYTFRCSNLGINQFSVTVADEAGNSSDFTFNVSIGDASAPTISSKNTSISLDENGQASIKPEDVMTQDPYENCNAITELKVEPNTFDCSNFGDNQVTITAIDASGNTSTETAIVSIQPSTSITSKTEARSINLFSDNFLQLHFFFFDIVNSCDIELIECTLNGVPIALQNGQYLIDLTCSEVGSNELILKVKDAAGNIITGTHEFFLRDATAPTIGKKDITINLDENGTTSISPEEVLQTYSDNCGIQTMTVLPNSFNCSNIGANEVTITVTDIHGNASTATAQVTVQDITAPTALCKDVTVKLNNQGQAKILFSAFDNGSTDNCSSEIKFTIDGLSEGTLFCDILGEFEFPVDLTDEYGNESSCDVKLKIVDDIAPIAICKDATVTLDGAGTGFLTVDAIEGGSFDNCSIDSYALDWDEFSCEDMGTNLVQLTAFDKAGLSSTCTAEVTVVQSDDLSVDFSTISVGPSSGT
ncbi:MAG: hypothetical protein AAFO07_19120, partial [Bacteroidota bacterium]